MDKKFIKGTRYFQYDEKTDSIICYRIIGYQNDNVLKMSNIVTKERIKITKQELMDNYYLLKPDGQMHFTIVTMPDYYNTGKTNYDVVVFFYKKDDSNPYAVCRQNVAGFHSNMIMNPNDVPNRGFSICRDTCPGNIKFEQFLVCNELVYTDSIVVYLDDKLDDMLESIKTKEFDRTLDSIWNDFLNTIPDISDRNAVNNIPYYLGYCRTLKSLLQYNDFMDDFLLAFNVVRINNVLNMNGDLIDDRSMHLLTVELGKPITNYICIPYAKDIELDEITRDFVLVADNNYNIYVFIYELFNENDLDHDRMSNEEKLNIINKLTNM